MGFTIGLAQCCHPEGGAVSDVVALAREWCRRAHEQGVDLLVFPESLMTRYEMARGEFMEAAQLIDGAYCQAMNALAHEFGLWLVYTVNEANPDGNPFNTAVITGSDGVMRGVYRKVHLFDSAVTRESARMAAGDRLFTPVEAPFGRIGLSICYDLRFPEVARSAALAGCDVLVNPAAWVAGPLKTEQWRTLLAARAIENEMFVAGVSRVDSGYVGQSAVFAPDGVMVAHGDGEECLVTAQIDLDEIRRVRTALPVFEHRRPECYRLA